MIDEYETKDLGEATVLITKGKQLVRMDKKGNVCYFVYEGNDECKKISDEYFFGECLVNARKFTETMSMLKRRIFS